MPTPKTVRVKLNCSRAGHSYDAQGRQTGIFAQAAGDVIEMPADEAQRNIDAGLAQLFVEDK